MIPMGARGPRKCFVINGAAYPVTKCRCCFRDIVFTPTRRGKRQPRDSDGRLHWLTCPCQEQKRRAKHYRPPGQLRLL